MSVTVRNLLSNTFYSLLMLILVVVIFYYFLDLPIDQWVFSNVNSAWLNGISQYVADIFAPNYIFAVGVLVSVIGLYLHFVQRKPAAAKPWLVCGGGAVLAFVVAFAIKVILARYRPFELFEHGLYGFHFFSTADQINSMPSGHSVLISAFCFALSRIVQRWWATVLLLVLALTVMATRIILIRHYPSDIIVGAYIGIMSVIWVQTLLNYKKS